MPMPRVTIKTFKEVLRCKFELRLSNRQIGESLAISPSTVSDCLTAAKKVGVDWPLSETQSEAELEQLLYPSVSTPNRSAVLPDWAAVHQELKRKGVTLCLLWEEYSAAHGEQTYS